MVILYVMVPLDAEYELCLYGAKHHRENEGTEHGLSQKHESTFVNFSS